MHMMIYQNTEARTYTKSNKRKLQYFAFILRHIYLSTFLSLFILLPMYLYAYLTICISMYLSVYLSIYISMHQYIYASIYLCINISIFLSIQITTYLSQCPKLALHQYGAFFVHLPFMFFQIFVGKTAYLTYIYIYVNTLKRRESYSPLKENVGILFLNISTWVDLAFVIIQSRKEDFNWNNVSFFHAQYLNNLPFPSLTHSSTLPSGFHVILFVGSAYRTFAAVLCFYV